MAKIWFRADASRAIGAGHVMRCATLAAALRRRGVDVAFLSRELEGDLNDWLRRTYSFHVEPLHATGLEGSWNEDAAYCLDILGQDSTADWLVVDHYGLDARWEKALSGAVKHLMVIDDQANRDHACDLLLDQNLYPDAAVRYQGLVPPECRLLLGPHYALLRPDFLSHRSRLRPRSGEVKRLLVAFGGSDPTNETSKSLEAIRLLGCPDLAVDVVIGAGYAHRHRLEDQLRQLSNSRLHLQTPDMASLLETADLALGAGGTSSWERCCMGLPSLIVAVAANQEPIAQGLHDAKAGWYLGPARDLTPELLAHRLRDLLARPELVRATGEAAAKLVDGCGADRVTAVLWEMNDR